MTWETSPTEFSGEARKDLDKTAKHVAQKVLRNVVFNSPVDTGRFRGNWIVGIAKRSFQQLKRKDKSGGSTFQKGKNKLQKSRANVTIFITNNLPYAQRLNEGWSSLAPANFVQAAIRRALK